MLAAFPPSSEKDTENPDYKTIDEIALHTGWTPANYMIGTGQYFEIINNSYAAEAEDDFQLLLSGALKNEGISEEVDNESPYLDEHQTHVADIPIYKKKDRFFAVFLNSMERKFDVIEAIPPYEEDLSENPQWEYRHPNQDAFINHNDLPAYLSPVVFGIDEIEVE